VIRVHPLRRRLRNQSGYTLTELIVTMSILGIVLGGLTQLFSAGLRAETDVAFRHQAQSEARNALSYLRQEAHCASAVSYVDNPGPPLTQTLTLSLPAGCRRPVGETAGSNSVWCTVSVSTYRFQLYRKAGGGCDNTGKKYADYLTQGNFIVPSTSPSTELRTLSVTFPVDPNSSATTPNIYRLSDDIVLRNTVRS
jgi:prepilin-type N-terminal cleavage/methylation domain-containing protein